MEDQHPPLKYVNSTVKGGKFKYVDVWHAVAACAAACGEESESLIASLSAETHVDTAHIQTMIALGQQKKPAGLELSNRVSKEEIFSVCSALAKRCRFYKARSMSEFVGEAQTRFPEFHWVKIVRGSGRPYAGR